MQQDKGGGGGGGSEEIMKQNQDRRLKPMQGENQPQQQQNQPQKCPRRYWTQGGTLRNVPVGGGCRKGKRAKASSSASSSSSENSRSHSQSQNIVSTNTNSGNTANPALRTKELASLISPSPAISSMGPYYSGGGGGFLGSLAAIQSLNNHPIPPQSSFSLNLPMNLAGDIGGPSNLSLLHGFNSIPSYGSQQQQQIQQQRQFYQMGNRDTKSTGELPFYASSHHHQQQQHQNWHNHQAFISNNNPAIVSDTALWSISTSTTTASTNRETTTTGGSFSLNPADQWHDLPGYGPSP
ncbi:dof zinc finger protein 1 isoform X2 [Jatropha curcas]|uniref:dof zinc finger protein 1 isoform X2 n=1 Tax=Jatropha curcas TaxID=180498 RepID=UPI0009D70F34|nr:dof zinc finger protein 1 isoform X2 [Jatropha curcas]